jgi:hypothetical protein
MRRLFLALPLLLWPAAAGAQSRAPLQDPSALNIGLNCQWQQRCIKDQQRAMKRALKFVRKEQPPVWRVELCNRNAGRQRYRVDWVGFDNCIRNTVLRPIPARIIVVKRRPRRLTESAPPAAPAFSGERG